VLGLDEIEVNVVDEGNGACDSGSKIRHKHEMESLRRGYPTYLNLTCIEKVVRPATTLSVLAWLQITRR
jgi:hypothetical protein